VNCVIQDRRGFLWFGTSDGLNRYDGYQFKVYRNQAGNANSLSNNYVLSLLEDRQGYLWIGTFGGGLNRLNPATGEFTRYQHKAGDATSISGNDIRALYEDENGNIWLGIYGSGLGYLNPKTQKFRAFIPDPKRRLPTFPGNILTFLPDKQQGLWVGTYRGLLYFDRQKSAYTKHFEIHANESPVIDFKNVIYSLSRDRLKPHILWLCTVASGLLQFDTRAGKIINQWTANVHDKNALQTNSVWSLHQDRQGTYWVGTKQGFYQFKPQTGQFTLYPSDPYNPRKLAGTYIQQIFEDKAGTLWLCSYRRGVGAFQPYLINFDYYPSVEENQSQISSFCEDDEGNIWVGFKGGNIGLARLDRKTRTLQALQPTTTTVNGTALSEVNVLLKDLDGTIWIGSIGHGLDHYDPKTKKFEHYLVSKKDTDRVRLRTPHIGSLYQDPAFPDELWVGTRGDGLLMFDKKNKKFLKHYLKRLSFNKTNLSHNTVISIAKDYKGSLWLATRGGLNRLDPHHDHFTNYLASPKDSMSLSSNYVTSVHIDAQKILWIGTHQGLNKLDLKKVYQGEVQFQHYTTKQGLPSDLIHKIIEDAQGFLWLSTDKGLSRFDKKQQTFKNFDEQDGLQGEVFLTNSGLFTKDKTMLMGGTNGFNLFYPHKMKQNTYAPPVVFTDFQIANQSILATKDGILTRPLEMTDTIAVSYEQAKVLTFRFAALNYVQPHKNTYAILMENYQEKWRNIGERTVETYTNLSPGVYTLRVKAANNDGIWSKKEAQLVVIVHPAWWQTKWFAISLSILGILLFWSVYYVTRLVTQAKKKRHTIPEYTGMPLTSNVVQPVSVEEKTTSLNLASSFEEGDVVLLKQKLHEVVVEQQLYKEEDLSVGIIAEKMGITEKQLSGLFNKELATSFYDYINLCKVNAFKERIKQGDAQSLKLITVAYESGFHSKATFHRIFKKYTGLTPSQYKQQVEYESNT